MIMSGIKMPENYERPKIAVDSFIYIFRDNVEVTHTGYKLILKKTKEYVV